MRRPKQFKSKPKEINYKPWAILILIILLLLIFIGFKLYGKGYDEGYSMAQQNLSGEIKDVEIRESAVEEAMKSINKTAGEFANCLSDLESNNTALKTCIEKVTEPQSYDFKLFTLIYSYQDIYFVLSITLIVPIFIVLNMTLLKVIINDKKVTKVLNWVAIISAFVIIIGTGLDLF